MPGDPRMRASDADRERTASLLREHHAQGRLTAEEFNDRLDRAFTATTLGELDALLADLPGIDLYRLPAAGIRPAPPGAVRSRSGRGGGSAVSPRGDGTVSSRRVATWVTWAAISSLLLVVWLVVGVASGGAAWFPWFLFVVVPWAIAIARRPGHP